MQSKWRVACVRIPRFPIGAVWQHAIAEGKKSTPRTGVSRAPEASRRTVTGKTSSSGAVQLSLVNADSPKPGSGTTDSFFAKEDKKQRNENSEKPEAEGRGQRPKAGDEARGQRPEARKA